MPTIVPRLFMEEATVPCPGAVPAVVDHGERPVPVDEPVGHGMGVDVGSDDHPSVVDGAGEGAERRRGRSSDRGELAGAAGEGNRVAAAVEVEPDGRAAVVEAVDGCALPGGGARVRVVD